jgi:hypothetical protein
VTERAATPVLMEFAQMHKQDIQEMIVMEKDAADRMYTIRGATEQDLATINIQ